MRNPPTRHRAQARAKTAVLALTISAIWLSAPASFGSRPRQEMPNMHARFMADASMSAIEIGLRVGIGYMPARIRAGNMTFFWDPDYPERTSATALIDARTVNTGNDEFDRVLKSPGWLDTDNHSHILFHSSGMGEGTEAPYLAGDLTIKDTTRSVRLWIDEISDVLRDPQSKLDMVHFSGHTTINRSDFGLGAEPMFNQPRIGDLPMVGEEISLALHVTGFSFNGEHLAQMFRQPLEDGTPHPVGHLYDVIVERGTAAGLEEYARLAELSRGAVDHSTLSDVAWYLMLTASADDAIVIFDESIEEKPDEWMTYLRQGDAYVFAGRRDEAIHSYRSMWDRYPTLPHIPEMLRLLGVENPTARPGR